MKKALAIVALIFVTGELLSQQGNGTTKTRESKLQLHSLGLGLGIYGTNLGSQPSSGGLSTAVDIAFSHKDHLLSVYVEGGSEVVFSNFSYKSYAITYGRTFAASKRIRVEGHIGLGYVGLRQDGSFLFVQEDENKSEAFGVPLRLKMEFMLGKVFALGLNPNVIVNNESVIYSGMLSLGLKF